MLKRWAFVRFLRTEFYLYGESYKSEIRTLSAIAIFSIESILGIDLPFQNHLKFDFEIPLWIASFLNWNSFIVSYFPKFFILTYQVPPFLGVYPKTKIYNQGEIFMKKYLKVYWFYYCVLVLLGCSKEKNSITIEDVNIKTGELVCWNQKK